MSKEYPTFHETVTRSPQWTAWREEQAKRLSRFNNRKNRTHYAALKGIYDMAEVEECGWISQGHLQDFLKFCKSYKP